MVQSVTLSKIQCFCSFKILLILTNSECLNIFWCLVYQWPRCFPASRTHLLSARSFFFNAASRFCSCSSSLSQSCFCKRETNQTSSVKPNFSPQLRRLGGATYMLTGWAEPLSVGDDHEGRPQTSRVVAAVTRVAQEDLRKTWRDVGDR